MSAGELTIVVLGALLALLGCVSLWRRASYLCDGISHASVLSSAIAAAVLFEPTLFSILFSVALVLLIRWLERSSDMYIATNIASTTSIAAAMLLWHFFPSKTELPSLAFGCSCCHHIQSVRLTHALILCAIFTAFLAAFFRQIVLIAFNQDIAAVVGVKVKAMDVIFLAIAAAVINVAVVSVGFLLVGALLIFPAVASNFFVRTPLSALISSACLGALNSAVGVVLAARLNLPMPSVVALVSFATFLLAYFLARSSFK